MSPAGGASDDDVLRALEAQFGDPGAATDDDGPAVTGASGADPASPAPAVADDGAADEPLVLSDDDLAALTGKAPPTRALVLTQVDGAAPLAAACALTQVAADVVPTEVGAVAVLRDPTAGAAAAGAVSKLLRVAPVVLFERREGEISVSLWQGGEHAEDLSPGIVMSDVPEVVEDLLLADADVATLDGVVTSVGLSRVKAMAMLARTGRRKKP